MIEVEASNETQELLQAFGITLKEVQAVVNNRDQGVVDQGVNRLIAVGWNGDKEALLVDSTVTAKRVEGNVATIERVRVMLALRLEASLPAGRISRELELEALMLVVAESFGQSVSFHSQTIPVVLYSGPWEENILNFGEGAPGQNLLVLATVSPSSRSVFAGWAFSLNKYLSWVRRSELKGEAQISRHDNWQPPENAGLVLFSGDFASESLRKFGIREEQALEVVNAPDKTDQLEFHGFVVRLHLSNLKTQPPSRLLVIESVKEGRRNVDFAFRVFPQLGTEAQDARPLEVLRMLTDSFGLLLKVGRQTGKLILAETIDFAEDIVEILESPNGSFTQQCYLMVGQGPLPVKYCCLAYCIETDLYSDWLKAMARRVN